MTPPIWAVINRVDFCPDAASRPVPRKAVRGCASPPRAREAGSRRSRRVAVSAARTLPNTVCANLANPPGLSSSGEPAGIQVLLFGDSRIGQSSGLFSPRSSPATTTAARWP